MQNAGIAVTQQQKPMRRMSKESFYRKGMGLVVYLILKEKW
ncbi:hypothetical protein ACHXY8_12355 [Neobacillus thermocopriae]|nr:hypothetical protein [Neobacillus thermocopriae]